MPGFLDTLVWSLAKQQQTSHRRLAHTSTQVGSYLFIVGGHNAVDYVSDVLMYNLGKIIMFTIAFLIILTFTQSFLTV
jgi:Kelch motif